MQPMLFDPEKDYVQPVENSFLVFLKAQKKSDNEIQEIIEYIKKTLTKINKDSPEYLSFKFALETNQNLHNKSKREVKKQYCMTRYRELEESNLKRSEKVKIIAKELGVKKNCIQVYLREIFKGF